MSTWRICLRMVHFRLRYTGNLLGRYIVRMVREREEFKSAHPLPPEEQAELDAKLDALRREFRDKHGFDPP